jgi:energy-coupling factor transporter ATP-binding protein EcfA2
LTAQAADSVSELLLRRVSEVEARPVRWLWPGRIARGKVTLLAGHPGLGKSQACLSLAAIVSKGGTWPVDGTPCESGSVLICSAEDDAEDTIRPRLEAAGADLSRCHILEAVEMREPDGTVTRRGFSLSDDLLRLSAQLAELRDVALVIIDPLTAYLGKTDSHKAADVRAVLAPLGEVAAKHGAAIVAVSHLRKSGAGEAMLQVTGSLAFVAAARAVYIVAKDQADPARRLMLPMKNNLGDDQTGYAFRIESVNLPGSIETSRVTWEAGRVTVTADEALAPAQASEERTEVAEAADWLRGVIAGGAIEAKDVLRFGEAQGFNGRTVQRARERIGAISKREGFGKGSRVVWTLPIDDNKRIDDKRETLSPMALPVIYGAPAHAGEPDSEVF